MAGALAVHDCSGMRANAGHREKLAQVGAHQDAEGASVGRSGQQQRFLFAEPDGSGLWSGEQETLRKAATDTEQGLSL